MLLRSYKNEENAFFVFFPTGTLGASGAKHIKSYASQKNSAAHFSGKPDECFVLVISFVLQMLLRSYKNEENEFFVCFPTDTLETSGDKYIQSYGS